MKENTWTERVFGRYANRVLNSLSILNYNALEDDIANLKGLLCWLENKNFEDESILNDNSGNIYQKIRNL